MKSEKEMYAGFGNRSDELEKSPSYLCSVSSLCALEIDLFMQGKDDDLTNVNDVLSLLERYQLEDTDDLTTYLEFPYQPLFRAMAKDSEKEFESGKSYYGPEIYTPSQMALEMRLLRYELKEFPRLNKERQRDMMHFFIALFYEYHAELPDIRPIRWLQAS